MTIASTLRTFSTSPALPKRDQDACALLALHLANLDEPTAVGSARCLAEVLLAGVLSSSFRHPSQEKAKDLGEETGLGALSALANQREGKE